MRYVWSRFILLFLLLEVAAFTWYYHFGPCGRKALHQLQEIARQTQEKIDAMVQKNNDLQDQIESWKTDPFLQEKFAREKLAMQKQGEIIYFR